MSFKFSYDTWAIIHDHRSRTLNLMPLAYALISGALILIAILYLRVFVFIVRY